MALFLLEGVSPEPPAGGSGVISSNQSAVVRDLNQITQGDATVSGNIEPSTSLGEEYGEVTYSPSLSSFGTQLVSDLVMALQKVIVVGVDLSTNQSVGGPTGLGSTEELPGKGQIWVYYDTSQCQGRGSHVYDRAGKEIADPGSIILAHELAHARDYITGSITSSTPESVAEAKAIEVENQIRPEIAAYMTSQRQISVDLGQRDPTNHGGGCNPTGKTGNFWSDNCLIASAAFDSPLAPEVQALRQIRETHLRATRVGREFFTRFYAEYYRFSPRVAALMRQSENYRQCVRTNLVEPLLECLSLAELLLWDRPGMAARREATSRLMDRSRVQIHSDTAALVLGHCSAFQSRPDHRPYTGVGEQGVPDAADDQIAYTFAMIIGAGGALTYTNWGLVEPLRIYLSARTAASTNDDPRNTIQFEQDLRQWVSRVPVAEIDRKRALAILIRPAQDAGAGPGDIGYFSAPKPAGGHSY